MWSFSSSSKTRWFRSIYQCKSSEPMVTSGVSVRSCQELLHVVTLIAYLLTSMKMVRKFVRSIHRSNALGLSLLQLGIQRGRLRLWHQLLSSSLSITNGSCWSIHPKKTAKLVQRLLIFKLEPVTTCLGTSCAGWKMTAISHSWFCKWAKVKIRLSWSNPKTPWVDSELCE